MFDSTLKEIFYEGIGAGFAETLCRFLRTLSLPENPALPLYEKILDLEWERCYTLISKLSLSHTPLIERGFLMELEKKPLDDGIRRYIQNKLNKTQ